MSITCDSILKLNDELEVLLEKYNITPVSELMQEMNISSSAKNQLSSLTRRIIAYANMQMLERMEDNNQVIIKTVKLDKYGRLKEAVSFPAFGYCELVNETWEDSSLRECFYNKVLVFTVFQNIGKELFLKKIVLWQMPSEVLEVGVRAVWERMRECLVTGNVVKYIDNNGRYFSFFPSSTDNSYVHVRPHARDRNDTNRLPVQDQLTGLVEYPKHSFWLNRAYVLKILSKEG